ncbi:hypothetical protein QT711_09545 [Sporosarcina saromensis]|uniref:Uncharacterized protein n=1 Tax=Sporosarcina saromensis TaxID=359365 RepID=A0ABU4G8Y7_9BACL|nr:hypothetical protein [Sporosarcina saromensis]MDW0113430.1 hypothetical protein [Sporosarcina saromensis]
MSRRSLYKVSIIGIVAGLLLALFFKVVEERTSHKVYTLLLNIDYIPVLNTVQFPEIVEVGFHIIISIAVCLFLFLFIRFKKITQSRRIIRFCVVVNVLIAILYYPTTLLSERTPAFTNLWALVFWIIGHIGYGWIVGVLLSKLFKNK